MSVTKFDIAIMLMPNYNRLEIVFSEGNGCRLSDQHGRHYLDMISGIAVCGLGHAHPAVAAAIHYQADRLLHTSNLYRIELQEKLAAKLVSISGMDAVFFCNSGSEANEAAIKLVRLHAHEQGNEKPLIASMQQGFHGRTMATWSATKPDDKHYAPLLAGFRQIPYADIDSLKALIKSEDNLAAVILEPVQGEGGIRIAPDDYLSAVRELCDQYNLLLILDEVQSGVGRTGRWYCYQHSGIEPDIMTTAKALGNGVPIGACLAKKEIAQLFQPGLHGSTFGGNPLACRAAIAVLETIEKDKLCQQAAKIGDYLLTNLKKKLSSENIREIRGRGLMVGIELAKLYPNIVSTALKYGLLINLTAQSVVRLLPPLILTENEADEAIEKLSAAFADIEKNEQA